MKQVLKKGSFGEEVKQWQLFLQSAGYRMPYVDGAFGPETERETLKFQAKNGLKPDGIVGPKTWKFITTVSENTPLSQRWPKQDYTSMVNFYGPVGENQTKLDLPYPMRLAWDLNTTVKKVTCHQKVSSTFGEIFQETLDYYGLDKIKKLGLDIFGGMLNIRKMRGGSSWSHHSWGCVCDIDPNRNQLKWRSDKAFLAKEEYKPFWKIVYSKGMTGLGPEKNYDWMHLGGVDYRQ